MNMTHTTLPLKWLLTLLLLGSVTWLHAQSAYEYIEEHRQWMKEHYPKAESLNEPQLLREAAFAISDELREPEAMALLHTVGKQVPEVEEYATFEETDGKDYKFTHTLKALEALYRHANRQLGRENATTGWCKYLWMNSRSNMENIYSLMDGIIREQEAVAKKSSDKENKALVCLFKLMKFEASSLEYITCSPDLYLDVLQTEKEIIKLFPPETSFPCHTKAFIYMMLGKMKSFMNAKYENDWATNQVGGFLVETPYCLNTSYNITTNCDYYLSIADSTYTKLYTSGHPEVVEFYACWENAKSNYASYNEDNYNVAKNLYDYACQYYPTGSLAQTLRKVYLWNKMMQLNMDVKDAFTWKSLLDKLKQHMGENNDYYISFVANIMVFVAFYQPSDLNGIQQYYDNLLAQKYGAESMTTAWMKYNAYSALKDTYPDLYKAHISEVIKYYSTHHDKSIQSLLLGRQLASDFYALSNQEAGTKFQQMVCQDALQHYGASSYVYLQEKAQELNMLSSYDANTARKQYPKLIKDMKNAGFDHSEIIADYATLEYGAQNNELAAKLYQQAYEESANEGDTHKRAYFLLSELGPLKAIQNTERRQEEVYRQAQHILDTNTDTLSWICLNFEMAARYLNEKGMYKEAIEMIHRGIATNDRLDLGCSNQYFNLLILQYQVYYYGLDDLSTTYRLVNEDIDRLGLEREKYYTINMLWYLWNVYDIIKQNYADMHTTAKYMSLLTKMTLSIAQQHENNGKFLCTYGIRLFGEMISLYSYVKTLGKTLDTNTISKEQLDKFKEMLHNYENMFNSFLKDGFDHAEELFRENLPDYETNTYYFTFLDACEEYFTNVEQNYDKALTYLNREMSLINKYFPKNTFSTRLKLFDFYLKNGKYDLAQQLYNKHLQQIDKQELLSSTKKAALYDRACNLYFRQGDFNNLLPFARKVYENIKDVMDHNFPLLTEQEQDNFIALHQDPANWLTTCLAGYNDKQKITGEVYDAVLYRTGIQLRSQKETRNAIMKSGNKELISLVDSLNLLHTLKDKIQIDYIQESLEEQNHKRDIITEYQSRINTLERFIMDQSAPYRNKTPLDAKWTQVRDQLKPGEAAIEFIYAHPYWMALIVKPGCSTPTPIKLTPADSLSNALQKLGTNNATAIARRLYNDQAINLYSILWKPMENELKDVHKVYYAAQGLLYSIAMAAIATPDGKYLTDHYDLCPLTTTSQLLQKIQDNVPKSAVMMGNIYYSDKQKEQVMAGDIAAARGNDDTSVDDFSDRGAKRYHFKYLPFTQQEVNNLKQALSMKQISIYEGNEATEKNLRKQMSKAPDILHLATHGFFIANELAAAKVPFLARHTSTNSNSMQRAGVALAGAEDTWNGTKTPPEADDGILTANEVAQMNLHGTQLVTLSACETALGNYTFEGVFGLPRGFKQAGVESLLVSLWSVNDKSTAQLMTAFYRYWMQGETKQQAFKHAVNDVRKDYPEPFYWAPFILLDAIK